MNLQDIIMTIVERMFRRFVFRAQTTAVTGNLVTIRRHGQAGPEAKKAVILSSYTPATGHEVLCIQLGTGVVILGRIIR